MFHWAFGVGPDEVWDWPLARWERYQKLAEHLLNNYGKGGGVELG